MNEKVSGADRVAHLEDGAGDGSMFGRLVFSWTEGVTEFRLRWLDLTFETELFTASSFGGDLSLNDGVVGGVVECGSTAIPAALFGEEEASWAFERGSGRIFLEGGNVRIPGMKLLGSTWSLRFRGKVHVSGDLDFVVVIAPAEVYRFRVDELDEQGPEAWKEQAGRDVRIFRIRGKIDQPIVRPLGPYDPVVIR